MGPQLPHAAAGRVPVDDLAAKERLAELVADGVPFWRICEVIGRDRWPTRRNINYLMRPPRPEPARSPLRLSLAEREEISRGLAGGESLRAIAHRLGRAPVDHLARSMR